MAKAKPSKQQRQCPECGKRFAFTNVESTPSYPFCSARCKELDLGAWLSEDYRIVEEVSLLQPSLDDMPDDANWQ